LADANATVSGRNAIANAVADTASGILSSMSLSATASPVNNINTTSVRAYGLVGSGFESFPSNTAAHAAGLPVASEVNNNLSGDPNATAAYNSPDGKTKSSEPRATVIDAADKSAIESEMPHEVVVAGVVSNIKDNEDVATINFT
jgi:hypothetical protein